MTRIRRSIAWTDALGGHGAGRTTQARQSIPRNGQGWGFDPPRSVFLPRVQLGAGALQGEPRPGWPGRCVSSAGHGSRAKAGRGVCSQAGSSAVAGELVRAVAPGLRAQTLRQLIPPNVSEGRTAPAAKSSKEAVGGPLDAFLGRRFALRFWKLLAISRCTAKI